MSAVRGEEGVTLVELLVVILIGSVVMLALFGLVDVALPAAKRIDDRTETEATGRNAMETIVRELRTATCARTANDPTTGAPTYQSPVGDASSLSNGTQVTFYASVVTSASASFAPEKRQLVVVGNRILEHRWTASGSPGSFTWPAASAQADRLIADGIAQVGANPVFTYSKYNAAGALVPFTPATAADLPLIAQVGVQFKVLPHAGATPTTDTSSTFNDQALIQVPVDPLHPDQGPQCAL